MDDRTFDIVVAGGGLTGFLSAIRFNELRNGLKILILEKELRPGGRLRTLSNSTSSPSYGTYGTTKELLQFWQQNLTVDPNKIWESFEFYSPEKIVSLSGSDFTETSFSQFFGGKGAKMLAGNVGAREFDRFLSMIATEQDKPDVSMQSIWTESKQSAASTVLEIIGACVGISSLWSSSLRAFLERVSFHIENITMGNFEKTLINHFNNLPENITLTADCQIMRANYESNLWTLETSKGNFTSSSLVVAQSPWQAMSWLPRDFWPTSLLTFAIKTKPVSLVVLSDRITATQTLPDMILIPSEKVQAIVNQGQEITFQATLDYEISLQAPDATKAIKRLKRAKKKLQNALPDLELSGDHIALLPVAWAQSPLLNDSRYIEKLAAYDFNNPHLLFCGDAYGQSYNGDKNIIKSILAASEHFKEITFHRES